MEDSESRDGVSTSWEEMITIALAVTESMDEGRWELGRIAAGIERRDIPKLAAAIKVGSASLRQYRQCAEFYPPEFWNTYFALSWSHYHEARKAADGDLEIALEWLEKANDLAWPVDELKSEIRRAREGKEPAFDMEHALGRLAALARVIAEHAVGGELVTWAEDVADDATNYQNSVKEK